jgi:hypothetical protein
MSGGKPELVYDGRNCTQVEPRLNQHFIPAGSEQQTLIAPVA